MVQLLPAKHFHLLNHGLFQLILEYNFGQKRAKAMNKTNWNSVKEHSQETLLQNKKKIQKT
jgi:hypothetical protein